MDNETAILELNEQHIDSSPIILNPARWWTQFRFAERVYGVFVLAHKC